MTGKWWNYNERKESAPQVSCGSYFWSCWGAKPFSLLEDLKTSSHFLPKLIAAETHFSLRKLHAWEQS